MTKQLKSIDYNRATKRYVLSWSDATVDNLTEAQYVTYIASHGLAKK